MGRVLGIEPRFSGPQPDVLTVRRYPPFVVRFEIQRSALSKTSVHPHRTIQYASAVLGFLLASHLNFFAHLFAVL